MDAYELDMERLKRRRAVADAILAQSMQPMGDTQMVSGVAVRRSPLEGMAKIAQALSARQQGNQIDADSRALIDRQRGDMASAMDEYTRATSPRPGSSEQIMDEEANGGEGAFATITAPPYAPSAGDKRSAAMNLMGRIGDPRDAAKMMVADALKAPTVKTVDLGDAVGLMDERGNIIQRLPKAATPDARLKEEGSDRRHVTPSGSAVLGADVTVRGQDLTDARTRSEGAANRGVTVRGQNMVDTRTREQMERDKFGPPTEVSGPDGKPRLAMQNKTTGVLVDATTKEPLAAAGPKMGEGATKQVAGVQNTVDALGQYRDILKNWSAVDALSPNARAKMGTVYNNALLQAKEAYNLGVLNGPDYTILQSVLTDPASFKGAITSNKAMEAQAKKLEEIMGRIGQSVTATQTGKYAGPERRGLPSADAIDAELRRRAGGG